MHRQRAALTDRGTGQGDWCAGMTADSNSTGHSRRPYGNDLAEGLGVEDAPFLVTRSLPHTEMAVTEIKVLRPRDPPSRLLPRLDAYMVVHNLQDFQGVGYWEDGRRITSGHARAGETSIHDLRREPCVFVDRPFHTIQWFVPRSALDLVADEANVPYADELRHEPGAAMFDGVIRHMSMSLLPALRTGEPESRVFVDHLALAFAAHLAKAYGGMQTLQRPLKGGLAPWQERRAKEMLLADLAGAPSLAAIAAACGVSGSYFARAFRRSTGLPPHSWLNQARIERARLLLRQRRQSLSEIALECGFVDQSHFTRVFARRIGLTPGAWQRMICS
jgi:AraC family transcriptional regulator